MDMTVMATINSHKAVRKNRCLISFEEAMEKLSRNDRFRATIYSMNTLLAQKGIYSPEEFEFQFWQFAQKHIKEDSDPLLVNLVAFSETV
jgi:hypothetical protein